MILIWTIFVAWRNLFRIRKSSILASNLIWIYLYGAVNNFPNVKRDSFLLIAMIGQANNNEKKNMVRNIVRSERFARFESKPTIVHLISICGTPIYYIY